MTDYTDVFTGIDYVHGTFCIVDSEAEYGYDEYVQECEDNEIEPAKENSHEFYMWCDEMAQADYECDMEKHQRPRTLQHSRDHYGCLGSLGWKARNLPRRNGLRLRCH